MSEPTLQSLKEQLDRIEKMLAAGGMTTTIQPMSDSATAFLVGGVDGLRELNKRRAAEARRKVKK
jgi:hypothetical protein